MRTLQELLIGRLALVRGLAPAASLEAALADAGPLGPGLVRRRLISGAQLAELLAAAEQAEVVCGRCGRWPARDVGSQPLPALVCPRCGTPLVVVLHGQALPDRAPGGAPTHSAPPSRPPSEASGGLGSTRGSGGDPAASSSLRGLAAGQQLGPYQLLDELGRGGMGVVFRARDVRDERVVALKLLLAGRMASEGQLARFRREGEVLIRLDHPHVVRVHEAGELGGTPFLAMDFVPGSPLTELIEKRRLTRRRALEVARDVARGLAHAHERGAIHRDVKPGNVLIGSGGAAVLTDFGLARDLESDERLTKSGASLGTPYYMAPEQVEGHRAGVTPLTDVYALGVLLYEMLTHQLPFQGGTQLELSHRILAGNPRPPGALEPGLDPDLEALVLRAMARDPDDRYPSAADLADDLERLLRRERPMLVRGQRRSGRGLRVGLALAGIGALAAGGAALLAGPGSDRPPPPGPPVADPGPPPPPQPPPPPPAPDDGAARLSELRAQARAAWARAATTPVGPPSRAALEDTLAALSAAIVAGDAADLRILRARVLERLGRRSDAAPDLRRARELDAAGGREFAEASFLLLRLHARLEEGLPLELAEDGLARAGPAAGPWRELLAALRTLARKEAPEEALAAVDRALALEPLLPDAHALRSKLLTDMGRRDEAEQAMERALELDPREPLTWFNRAYLRLQRGDEEGAIDDATRALELDPVAVSALVLRATALEMVRRHDDAARDLARAIDLDPGDPTTYMALARVRQAQGRGSEVSGLLEQAMQAAPRDPRTYAFRARALVAGGDVAAGLAVLRRGLDAVEGPGRDNLWRWFRTLVRSGPHLDAARAYLADRPADPDARLLVIEALLQRDELETAWGDLEQLLADHPDHLPARQQRLLTGARLASGPDELRPELERFTEAARRDAVALAGAARLWAAMQGDGVRASELAREAAALEPTRPEPWLLLGMLARAEGRDDEAAELARRAHGLDTCDAGPLTLLGNVATARGEAAAAESFLREALAVNPYDEQATGGLCTVLLQRGRGQEALERIRAHRRLCNAGGREPEMDLVSLQAQLLTRLGREAEVLPLLESLRRHPARPDLDVLLAQGLAKAGRGDDAGRVLDEVLARHPSYPPALALREQLGR